MSTDYLELGPVPCDEECVNVDPKVDYIPAMREEVKRYKTMLEARFPVPAGVNAWFSVKSNPHDFGTYYEVAIKYDEDDQAACEFAYWVEDNLPATWDDVAILVNNSGQFAANDKPGILAGYAQR